MRFLAILTLFLGCIAQAEASVITYNTTGSAFTGAFDGSVASGTSISATSGSSTATLTYSPIAVGGTFDDAAPGTNISYGFFTLSFSGTNSSILFPSFNFSLSVNETSPGIGSQSIVAVSTPGVVSANSSNVNIFYAPTTFNLPTSLAPNTVYTILNPTQIVAPTSNAGVSSIQGFAIGSPPTPTPESAPILLMGSGLVVIGLSRKKFFVAILGNSLKPASLRPR